MSGYSCPTCGADGFEKEHYMKLHHTHAHGESLAGVPVECAYCGNETRKRPHEVEKYEHNFCSTECKDRHHSESQTGEGNGNYRGGVPSTPCHTCGNPVEKYRSNIPNGRTFCSEDCRVEWWSDYNRGRGRRRVEVACETCRTTFEKRPSRIARVSHTYCSESCRDAGHAANIRGEDNPRWTGGYEGYYGPTWVEQRRQTIRRDGERCFLCGLDRENHYGLFRTDLHVHHMTPFREFDDSTEANRLSNLLTVCNYCHKRLET